MTDILTTAQHAFDLLAQRGVPAALVGGLAVSARTEPRFTRDVDIAIAVDDDRAAEDVVSAMRGIGYVPAELVEQEATGRLATARLVRPDDPGGVVLDLLFASSGVEDEITRSAEALELAENLVAPVASSAHLLATKLLSRGPARPQDDVDIIALLGATDDQERAETRRLLGLIEERGYGRGKSLQEDFDSVCSAASSRSG